MKPQRLAEARRLVTDADNSERQAEAYEAIASAIEALDLPDELKADELRRYAALAAEFYDDAEDLRARVDSDLIDQL